MKKLCLYVFGLILCGSGLASAQSVSAEFDEICRKAESLIIQGRLAEARQVLSPVRESNAVAACLMSQSQVYEVMLTGSDAVADKLLDDVDAYKKTINKAPESSPWQRYALAEVYIHQAVAGFKTGGQIQPALHLRTAYKLLKTNSRLFPDFLLTYKDLWMLEAGIGSIPEKYGWALNILGLSGNLNEAVANYRSFPEKIKANPELSIFYDEASLIDAMLLYHMGNQKDAASQVLMRTGSDASRDPMLMLIRMSLSFKLKESAQIDLMVSNPGRFAAFPVYNYYKGQRLLQQLRPESGQFLAKFIDVQKNGTYVRDAYLKLSYAWQLAGDTVQAHEMLRRLLLTKVSVGEEDVNATYEAKTGTLAHPDLLKARLLFDAGKLDESLAKLGSIDTKSLSQIELTEYYYRKGRDYESKGKEFYPQALQSFAQATGISLRTSHIPYFAPASCYVSGLISEKLSHPTEAANWFRKCLSYKDYPYEISFSQKAKAGLERVRKK